MSDKSSAGQLSSSGRTKIILFIACGAVIVSTLLLDFAFPLGIAVDFFYVIAILISLRLREKVVVMLVAILCSVFVMAMYLHQPPVESMWKVFVNRLLNVSVLWVTVFLGLQKMSNEAMREDAVREREKALAEKRTLQGMLPICASCKKIRDDKGYWKQIEAYISAHSETTFTHGICPECVRKIYPEFVDEMELDKSGLP